MVPSLKGLAVLSHAHPALKCWAKLFRPLGADSCALPSTVANPSQVATSDHLRHAQQPQKVRGAEPAFQSPQSSLHNAGQEIVAMPIVSSQRRFTNP
jgi:hypothetical protein